MQTPPANPQYAYAPSLGSTPNMPQVAQDLQSQGRGDDSMLVHMTPREVGGLQALAQQFGGNLTVNPNTGLPEAGWLGKLLPTIIGAGLAATGVGAPLAAGIVGLGQTALTGDLSKGLLAGLGAFGGASLVGAFAPAAAGAATTTGAAGAGAGAAGTTAVQTGSLLAPTAGVVDTAALSGIANNALSQAGLSVAPSVAGLGSIASIPAVNMAPVATNLGPTSFLGKFGQAASAGLGKGMLAKAAPYAAGLGLYGAVSDAFAPKPTTGPEETMDNSYQGPYYEEPRKATFVPTEELLKSSKGRKYFDVDIPAIYNAQGQMVQPGSNTPKGTPLLQKRLNPSAKKGEPMYSYSTMPWMSAAEEDQGMARGGEVNLRDGAFVLDARTVSELGNGSSSAGQELLARLGGRPVRGKGDGVSDSIPARIGRDQPARVARDEVIFDPEAVRKVGKGDHKKGAKRLYAMMEKAHKARKQAGRGTDTKLRRGLA